MAYRHGCKTLSALLHAANHIISWDASVVLRSHREIFWMHEVCSLMHPAILVTITQLKPALFSLGRSLWPSRLPLKEQSRVTWWYCAYRR